LCDTLHQPEGLLCHTFATLAQALYITKTKGFDTKSSLHLALTLPRGCPSSIILLPAIDLILIGFDDHRKEPQGTTRNKKPHKNRKSNMNNLSPRRVKPAPTIVLYELRLLRFSVRPATLLPMFEARTKKWRGVLRWALHAFSSGRAGAEVVLQVIVERQAVTRVDNLFATWRRTLLGVMGKAFDLRKLKRAAWLPAGSSDKGLDGSIMADVRVLFDAFDSGCAKLWADAHDPAAVRCSYLEPALPAAATQEKAARPQVPVVSVVSHSTHASGANSLEDSARISGLSGVLSSVHSGSLKIGSVKQPHDALGAPPRNRAPPSDRKFDQISVIKSLSTHWSANLTHTKRADMTNMMRTRTSMTKHKQDPP